MWGMWGKLAALNPYEQMLVGYCASSLDVTHFACSAPREFVDFLLGRRVALSATPKIRVTLDSGADEKGEPIDVIGNTFS